MKHPNKYTADTETQKTTNSFVHLVPPVKSFTELVLASGKINGCETLYQVLDGKSGLLSNLPQRPIDQDI